MSFTSAVLSWIPPTDSLCVTSYTVTLTKITEENVSYIYNTNTNTTIMTVSDLTHGVEYSFTVAGIDTGGRVGDRNLSTATITIDSELQFVKTDQI